ncbi:MAG TPA: hypothetical protein PLB18_14985, partial [Acidobacteriota bacterium]|nr:hypothetical protein [Acidobacteriota bacterium]
MPRLSQLLRLTACCLALFSLVFSFTPPLTQAGSDCPECGDQRDRGRNRDQDRDRDRDRDWQRNRDRYEDRYDNEATVYLAYRSVNQQRILVSSWDGGRWSYGQEIKDALSDVAPDICSDGRQLYLAYKGRSSNKIFYRTSVSGFEWSRELEVKNAQSNDSPSLAVYRGEVYLAYKGVNSPSIYIRKFDGRNWSGEEKVPNSESST